MEGFPSFLVAFNVCAATFPRFASAMGLVWVVGRVMYQLGYQKKGPKGRGRGSLYAGLSAIVLVILLSLDETWLTCSLAVEFMGL